MNTALAICLSIVMLLGNAFFVGAEFALVSARRSNIELRALAGSRLAKISLAAMEQVSLMLAGAQLGVTLCSLVFGAVAEPLVAHSLEQPFATIGLPEILVHPVSFIIALGLMVYVHVVFGEMIPKNISLAASTRAALILVPALWFFVRFTRPVVYTLNAAANAVVRLLGVKPRAEIRSSFSRDEVAGFVKESHREGLLSEEEEHLLSGTLDFEAGTVHRVLIPIDKLVYTYSKPTAHDIERLNVKTGFSRYPVMNASGKLGGYIHLKDILRISDADYDKPIASTFIRPMNSVQPTASFNEALAAMQQSSSHITRVVNNRGRLVGVVMLEDILEQLVGTIHDDTQKSVTS